MAARAKDRRGKRFFDQNRIRRVALREAEKLLLEQCERLRESLTFHDLWLRVKQTCEHVRGARRNVHL